MNKHGHQTQGPQGEALEANSFKRQGLQRTTHPAKSFKRATLKDERWKSPFLLVLLKAWTTAAYSNTGGGAQVSSQGWLIWGAHLRMARLHGVGGEEGFLSTALNVHFKKCGPDNWHFARRMVGVMTTIAALPSSVRLYKHLSEGSPFHRGLISWR